MPIQYIYFRLSPNCAVLKVIDDQSCLVSVIDNGSAKIFTQPTGSIT